VIEQQVPEQRIENWGFKGFFTFIYLITYHFTCFW
jgi:hypothetical protein